MNRRVFLKAGVAAAALPIVSQARGFGLVAAAPAVAVDPAILQQLLDESARGLGIVGAQLAVFDGEAVHEVATGLAVRERALAVTPDTLFQIGSTTKVFNAAVVMALVDEGCSGALPRASRPRRSRTCRARAIRSPTGSSTPSSRRSSASTSRRRPRRTR